jgi:predicted Holliday junction resolvase-like endonuclease
MLALEHSQANALLYVLFFTALAIVVLRGSVWLLQRALAARDREIIRSLECTASESPE